jgi:hypothetical protein
MDNIYASRLGGAARAAKPGGDAIDYGWSLLNELHARGFDIVPRDRTHMGLRTERTLNEACGLKVPD